MRIGLGCFAETGNFIGKAILLRWDRLSFTPETGDDPARCSVTFRVPNPEEAREMTLHSALRVVDGGTALFRGTIVKEGCKFYEEGGAWAVLVKAVGLLGDDAGRKWEPLARAPEPEPEPAPEPERPGAEFWKQTRLEELDQRISGMVFEQSKLNESWRIHQIEKTISLMVGLPAPAGYEGIDPEAFNEAETKAADRVLDRILEQVEKKVDEKLAGAAQPAPRWGRPSDWKEREA